VAVVVGKYGHTIVARNKLRRRLRELSRTVIIPDCQGLDLMIRAFPQAYEATYEVLKAEIGEIKKCLSTAIA
jgi:ribonuclease P protein component